MQVKNCEKWKSSGGGGGGVLFVVHMAYAGFPQVQENGKKIMVLEKSGQDSWNFS